MQDKPINKKYYIQTNDIDYDSSIATIRLLLVTIEPKLKKKYLDSLIEIIAFSGCITTKKDNQFLSSLIKKTEQKIDNYFHKKDLKEFSKRKDLALGELYV